MDSEQQQYRSTRQAGVTQSGRKTKEKQDQNAAKRIQNKCFEKVVLRKWYEMQQRHEHSLHRTSLDDECFGNVQCEIASEKAKAKAATSCFLGRERLLPQNNPT